MSKFRDWFWQLEEMGQGPDHFLTASFEAAQAGLLKSVVRQVLPIDFASNPYGSNFQFCHRCQSVDSYLDQHTLNDLKAMKAGGVEQNIYISSSIDACDHQLSFENAYARHEIGETAFLIAVFQSEGLTVQDWRVFAGGDGYDSIEVARGEDAVSFFEYLKLENQ